MSTDVRVACTKVAIDNAFWKVMSEKGFDKLKVTDIIEEAGINRTTFYSYYNDKFDVLGTQQGKFISDLRVLAESDPLASNCCPAELRKSLNNYFINMLQFIRDNGCKAKVLYLYRHETMFMNQIEFNAMQLYPYWEKALLKRQKVPAKYAFAGVIGMLVSIVVEWVRSDYDESVCQIASMATGIVLQLL
ncbi:TetR/AcrR family transcriptional regulator [Lentilactobacillus sp. Marseille-Q4993]|uniref:TetR/AcrR family transcriptional regulator n=1 Tax=Lentilactobacillus sp. Marseille-Q4993 TaxID=3039492 RepID=UPI0024BC1DE8|nr:TetR/AcrR family transcriptional regulator [Lentilactobacillus sp. Marseille-Q4993]